MSKSDISRASQITSSYPKEEKISKKLIDLDNQSEFLDDGLVCEPHKIFINNVDCFIGKYLSQYLFKQKLLKLDNENKGEDLSKEDVNEEESKEDEFSENEEFINSSADNKEGEINSGDIKGDDDVDLEENREEPAADDLHINELEDLSLQYKDNIFYELFDFSQLTVNDYYELSEIDCENKRKAYLKSKFNMNKKSSFQRSSSISKEAKEIKKQNVKHISSSNFEIVGTVKNYEKVLLPGQITIIQDRQDKAKFLKLLLKCGVVIFDISKSREEIKEATWALNSIVSSLLEEQNQNPQTFENSNVSRVFILISTLMTWALTKSLDPDDPEIPFMEEDFKRRKSHPNFKEHIALEREVLAAGKKFKGQFKTIVVGCGVTYGFEEDILHFLFKMGWNNKQSLPVLESGKNLVPLIHVEDLAALVHSIISDFPPRKVRYIFAKEQRTSTLKDIVKAISNELTSGKIERISKNEIFLLDNEVTQDIYNVLSTNLNLEASYIDELNINWHDELGFVESIEKYIKEYKEARNLNPLRIFLQGPIGSRRHILAKRLSEHYKLQCLTVHNITDLYITMLKKKIEMLTNLEKLKEEKIDKLTTEEETEEEEEVEEEELEEKETLEQLIEKLKEIEDNLKINFNKLDDEHLVMILKEWLLSKPCQNQGFILDGFPNTKIQAQALFGTESEEEEEMEEEQESEQVSYNKLLMPEFIFSMDGQDKILLETALQHDQEEERFEEDDIIKAISLYRKLTESGESVLDYFYEMGILPVQINTEHDGSPTINEIMEEVIYHIGPLRNYENLKIETLEEKQLREDAEKEHLLKLKQKQDDEQHSLKLLRQEKMEQWAMMVDLLKEEEEKMLAVKSIPIRNYLITEIFPTLTDGLIEVARVQPEDPIDYLVSLLQSLNVLMIA
uniref:Adenylate kinase 7 n=3 Tax=Clastoptera arizonana TaxID=38151 RepID=A0A1B6CKG7_9HEMI